MKSDKQIKAEATKKEMNRVYENMNIGQNIYAECSDGLYMRYFWQTPNGHFGWERWKKVY